MLKLGRKPHPLSALRLQPEERQAEIVKWWEEGGEETARQRLAAEGLKVSLRALGRFVQWWKLRRVSECHLLSDYYNEQIRRMKAGEKLLRDDGLGAKFWRDKLHVVQATERALGPVSFRFRPK